MDLTLSSRKAVSYGLLAVFGLWMRRALATIADIQASMGRFDAR